MTTSLTDLVEASRGLTDELAATAAQVDAAGDYPVANMRALHEAVLSALAVPTELGGASESVNGTVPALSRILTNIASGESSTAQIWMVSHGVASSMVGPASPLEPAARARIAAEVLDGARFCSAAAERVKPRFNFRTTGTPVPGGLRLTGTKRFATGVKGAAYAFVPVLHADYESIAAGGMHFTLIPLDAPGVTVVDDWDNMGQRATGSCTVELDGAFVPDGFHWKPSSGGPRHHDVGGPISQLCFAAIFLGIGKGALRAITPFLTGATPQPDNPFDYAEIARWQIGRHYAALRAAEALIEECAQAIAGFQGRDAEERARVSTTMMCAKVTANDAALAIGEDLHRLGGGRSTARSSALDMYWRNARTLTTHDPVDVKRRHLGAWAIDGTHPPIDPLN